MRGLWETRDYVQSGEGEGGTRGSEFGRGRTGGVRRNDAVASGGRDGLHTTTMLDTQDATGLIRTRSVNE